MKTFTRTAERSVERAMLREEKTWTAANVLTVVRAVAGVVAFSLAFAWQSEPWNFAGLAVYWVLDVADGRLARIMDEETRLGAQLDILADRLLVTLFYLNYLRFHPGLVLPVALFLFQFMFVDHYLSNQFMRWPIRSPNYFYVVDPRIYALNWSIPGKLLNSVVVTGVLVGTHSVWLSSLVAAGIIVMKLYSCVLMARLPSPELTRPDR